MEEAQRETAAAALVSYGNSRAAGKLSAEWQMQKTAERGDDREVLRYKKDCCTGQNPCTAVLFVSKKTDGTLCSARYPGLPMPFPYSRQSRNCDTSSNFIDCNPQKARRRKSRQQGTVHSCTVQKSKGRQPAYTHRRLFFHPATELLKEVLPPPPPQRNHVRTEGFLYWVQYSRVTLLLHKNCHILTVQMS